MYAFEFGGRAMAVDDPNARMALDDPEEATDPTDDDDPDDDDPNEDGGDVLYGADLLRISLPSEGGREDDDEDDAEWERDRANEARPCCSSDGVRGRDDDEDDGVPSSIGGEYGDGTGYVDIDQQRARGGGGKEGRRERGRCG